MAIINSVITEDTTIRPNPDLIFCFDDLLPEWIQDWGIDQMLNFDWKYGQASYPGGGKFFGQILKDHRGAHMTPWPPIIDIIFESFRRNKLKTLMPDANLLEIKKLIVNGQLPNTPANPHSDTQASDMWTMVYHCSDTDGGNAFFDGNIPTHNKPLLNTVPEDNSLVKIKDIDFKKGRCVLFPSWYIHQGLAPSNGWRITIAFHMLIETSLNQPRYITSL